MDTEWNGGERFDYIVASNGTDGALQREFIFHISKDLSENKLLIAADSRRSAGRVNEGIENSPNYLEIINTGWYTLQHIFYDKNDLLHVDLNLLDENGMLLFTETISDPKDVISKEIGGNRYGHFHFISITGGLNVDETELFRNCDENLGMYAENIY